MCKCCQKTDVAKTQMLKMRKYWENTNVANMQLSPKCKCCQNGNVANAQMLQKHKCCKNANVAKIQMTPKCDCCQNANVNININNTQMYPRRICSLKANNAKT